MSVTEARAKLTRLLLLRTRSIWNSDRERSNALYHTSCGTNLCNLMSPQPMSRKVIFESDSSLIQRPITHSITPSTNSQSLVFTTGQTTDLTRLFASESL